ncbi:MAG: hypothetical protein V7L14_09005 [Nostoc sp.]
MKIQVGFARNAAGMELSLINLQLHSPVNCSDRSFRGESNRRLNKPN